MRPSYSKEISREHPACLLYLLDQSYSMDEPLSGKFETSKATQLAKAINSWLAEVVIACTRDEGVRDYIDIGVVGYHTDVHATPIVESALQPPLSSKWLVPVSAIADNPARVETHSQELVDQETGRKLAIPTQVRIWVDPKAEGGTPMCHALHHVYCVLEEWIEQHPDSFPPIVIHVTDGESQDGDPLPYAEAVTSLATNNGNVLMFNCHLSSIAADQFLFPSSDELLPEVYARVLFEMSSELPAVLFERALAEGLDVQPGARGMAFNADLVTLVKFLDMGTRVARRLR